MRHPGGCSCTVCKFPQRRGMACRDCDAALIWNEDRNSWSHPQRPDDDHAPRPVKR